MTPKEYLQILLSRALPGVYRPPFEITHTTAEDHKNQADAFGDRPRAGGWSRVSRIPLGDGGRPKDPEDPDA